MHNRRLRRIAASPAFHAMPCSGVAKQRHEAKVHVLLDMAVKQLTIPAY
jgi:hypothetical protein